MLAACPLLADVQLTSAANSPILLKVTATLTRTLKYLFILNVPHPQTIFLACVHQWTTTAIKEALRFVVVFQF